jgi:hypothetical protein
MTITSAWTALAVRTIRSWTGAPSTRRPDTRTRLGGRPLLQSISTRGGFHPAIEVLSAR